MGETIKKIKDYKCFLSREYEGRVKKNPAYSMRAYARDIGVLPSRMSEIMSGKGGISVLQATGIASSLKLEGHELELFITSVTAKHSRSRAVRHAAQVKFDDLVKQDSFSHLEMERFKAVSDWHHIAILEMVHLKDFQSTPAWVARRLGVELKVAEEALQRLIQFNFLRITQSGTYEPVHDDLATPIDVPSAEIRKFHRQMLQKAEGSLEKNTLEERDFSSVSFAVRSDRIHEAKQLIRQFRRNFSQAIQSETGGADRVYSINIQFFPIDEVERG